jgi:single-stranded DNA-binding protein
MCGHRRRYEWDEREGTKRSQDQQEVCRVIKRVLMVPGTRQNQSAAALRRFVKLYRLLIG